MRYLILCTLALFLLSPACERTNPPDDQYDAGIVRPPDDGGSAMSDARTSRPGAGPLDPDLTLSCVDTAIQLVKDPGTGRVLSRAIYTTATWSEAELPRFSWLCAPAAPAFLDCGDRGPEECETSGAYLSYLCVETSWYVSTDGDFFSFCGYRTERDPDGDGVFEQTYPIDYTDAYISIVR